MISDKYTFSYFTFCKFLVSMLIFFPLVLVWMFGMFFLKALDARNQLFIQKDIRALLPVCEEALEALSGNENDHVRRAKLLVKKYKTYGL